MTAKRDECDEEGEVRGLPRMGAVLASAIDEDQFSEAERRFRERARRIVQVASDYSKTKNARRPGRPTRR